MAVMTAEFDKKLTSVEARIAVLGPGVSARPEQWITSFPAGSGSREASGCTMVDVVRPCPCGEIDALGQIA